MPFAWRTCCFVENVFTVAAPPQLDVWRALTRAAVDRFGTPCYVARWPPVDAAAAVLENLSVRVPIRCWLSFKTHPLPALARRWVHSGRGVEVVSEHELATVLEQGCPTDRILVNGVAKHHWLPRWDAPDLRVHFDSPTEVRELAPVAARRRWRVGVRIHAPDERDARDPHFSGQFGMTGGEAEASLSDLRAAGCAIDSVHFHLGQQRLAAGSFTRAVVHVRSICQRANVEPRVVDCGGGLPTGDDAAGALSDLGDAIRAAERLFPQLEEVWLENGRFVTEGSTVLAVRVLDCKERDECRYLICDGGRTNHALAADKGLHPMFAVPHRDGPVKLTTVCGPTCMTDDVLARLPLPDDIIAGDVLVWTNAGAYHLPWETRFSHGLCAVIWSGHDAAIELVRDHEAPGAPSSRSLWSS